MPASACTPARSRNDQVALDVRLWVRDAIDGLSDQLRDVMRALVDRAEEHAGTVMPGFTHLQPAQPVTLGHHFLAYVEMLSRDLSRLAGLPGAAERMPAGCGGARRHRLPDRPAHDGQGAGLRPADAQQPRFRGVARLRRRIPVLLLDVRDAPVALRRGDRDLDEPLFRVREAVRCLHHRQFDHAAEAQPRCRRAGARQDRARGRRAGRAADRDEGPGADLFQGHAGGQGRRVRRRRDHDAGAAPPPPAWCAT